ncbi:hypothetical protein F5B18DRAFT_579592 [Nemania serpens]|nr:hypothetical protein F5B18DRAFT_579592 [Nemania serpens]
MGSGKPSLVVVSALNYGHVIITYFARGVNKGLGVGKPLFCGCFILVIAPRHRSSLCCHDSKVGRAVYSWVWVYDSYLFRMCSVSGVNKFLLIMHVCVFFKDFVLCCPRP